MKQREILNDLAPDFQRDGQTQMEYIGGKRDEIVRFICEYTRYAHAKGWVIGISGGIDSFLVGALLALAADQAGGKLVCLLLPCGRQKDIEDAKACYVRIRQLYREAQCAEVNIGGGLRGVLSDLESDPFFVDDVRTVGNLQPRLRMMYQYASGSDGLLVAGTDHATEAITGFYTKYGDGGVDFNPIGHMVKDDIYAMSSLLDAPKSVMEKAPAAGLGISRDDESELGIAYRDICAFLKGERIALSEETKIISAYEKSAHKRAMPATPAWLNRRQEHVTHIHCGDMCPAETVHYINRHPEHEVLYVDVHQRNMLETQVEKTVNTPIERYNCFEASADGARNMAYGTLKANVHERCMFSGDAAVIRRVAPLLADRDAWVLEECTR